MRHGKLAAGPLSASFCCGNTTGDGNALSVLSTEFPWEGTEIESRICFGPKNLPQETIFFHSRDMPRVKSDHGYERTPLKKNYRFVLAASGKDDSIINEKLLKG